MRMIATLTTVCALNTSVMSAALVQQIKKALTFQQKALSPLAAPATVRGYTVHLQQIDSKEVEMLHVPKQYALEHAAAIDLEEFKDCQIEVTAVEAPMQLPLGLREHQQHAVSSVLSAYNTYASGGGAIICLPCGYGKTVTALYIAAHLGVKCLILTHTDVLAQQWRTAIEQYVPTASIGTVKQKVFDVENRTHIIASVQSVCKREYDWINSGIGLLIGDEVHHFCAQQLSKAIAMASPRYRLGLTATPTRADGLSSYLFSNIGPIVYRIERPANPELRCYPILLNSGIMQDKFVRGTINTAQMLNQLTNKNTRAQERQQLAATWIRLCCSKGRQVLVIADRIDLLKDLESRVNDPLTTAFLIGEVKAAARAEARYARVIFGSYAICSEGLDIPSLDTVLLLTARSGKNVIVQVVGRLMRTGGRPPLVIDFVDGNAVFKSMYRKRELYYRQMGAKITKYDEMRNEVP